MATEYLNNKVFESLISRFQATKRATARHRFLLEDIRDTIARKTARHILSESEENDLRKELDNYNSSIRQHDETREELTLAFYILSENVAKYLHYSIDNEDAVQEGVIICFEKIDRFDPRKGKAFNYMTTCIINHFRQIYRSSKNYNELKRKYLKHLQQTQGQMIIKNSREIPNWAKISYN